MLDIKSQNLSPVVFEKPYNEPLIHQVVTTLLMNLRAGTHQQKTRAEVSFSGAKPWNQKGSGRARAGTKGSPLWRKGGMTFARVPKKYDQKINKKMYHGAMCAILSQLVRDDRLKLVDNIVLPDAKTKSLVKFLAELKIENPLIIINEMDKSLDLASRNLPHTAVLLVDSLDPMSLLRHAQIVITKEALMKLNEALQHG